MGGRHQDKRTFGLTPRNLNNPLISWFAFNKIRRLRAMALETYRIIYKTSPVFIHDIVIIKQSSYNFRYNNTADIPRPRTTWYGKKSFSYEAARLWNSLPDQARNLSTFGTFKYFISTWCFSENCFCSSCRTQLSCRLISDLFKPFLFLCSYMLFLLCCAINFLCFAISIVFMFVCMAVSCHFNA